MIKVENLTKKYAATVAVDDISFEIEKNEIVGFLGPNGAGKSSTLKVLTCYHAASGGKVTIEGKDVLLEPEKVKARVGYLPENVPLYPEMRVEEYLGYRGGIKGLRGTGRKKAIRDAVARCRLEEVSGRIIGQLSKGYRQRVGLADALLADPGILVLDEPTIGLDPGQIREVRELIKELGRERTVILSSHILPEVQAVCDRVIIINRGKIVGSGRPDELRAGMGKNGAVIELEFKDPGGKFESAIKEIEGLGEPRVKDGGAGEVVCLTVDREGDQDPREMIFDAAVRCGAKILSMGMAKHSLEDVFVDIITSEEEQAKSGDKGEPGDGGRDPEGKEGSGDDGEEEEG